jgi:glycosyltransferase involved in cell wall biosynthesis
MKAMTEIVFIASNEYPWGGSEYLWAGAAERLASQGTRVRVSVTRHAKPVKQVEHLRSVGCQIVYRETAAPLWKRAIRKFRPPSEYFIRHLKKITANADMVVVSQGCHWDGLPWLEAARSLGLRYSVICQGTADNWWPDDDMVERLAAAWEGACCAFFVSERNADSTRRMLGTPLQHARIVRNPFNVRYDAAVPWPDSTASLSLAFVSRLEVAGKGHDLLFQVLELPHWRQRDIRVSLVGDGPNERSLRRVIENSKSAKVEITGFAQNIEALWSRHHALILPSRGEGMPLVLVEAMLCGRPAIATSVGGIPELVRDGINGFLAKAPTVEFLDDALSRAWESRDRLKEMGEQAAVDVRKLVPPDPVGAFVDQLRALAAGNPLAAEAPSRPSYALSENRIQ